MDLQQSILALSERSWSQRRIARELGVNRETVARYRRLGRAPTPATLAAAPLSEALVPEAKPAIPPAGLRAGRISQCEAYRTGIEAALERGLSAQRIYQDLKEAQTFTGGYDAVKRFVRALGQAQPLPFRRMESAPGQEAQVDFGQGAWVLTQQRFAAPRLIVIRPSGS